THLHQLPQPIAEHAQLLGHVDLVGPLAHLRQDASRSSSVASCSREIQLSANSYGGWWANNSYRLRSLGREVERGPLADDGLSPDVSAVLAHDALHRGESDASAGKLIKPVQALKGVEKLPRVFHVEAGAVVAHEVDPLALLHPCAE